MIRLSVWPVRTALIYLAAGFLIGALMLTQKGVPLDGALLRLLPLHIEFVLVGWTLQLGMGIAFRILPRFSREPRYGNRHAAGDQPRLAEGTPAVLRGTA